jgi:hypothetical protein
MGAHVAALVMYRITCASGAPAGLAAPLVVIVAGRPMYRIIGSYPIFVMTKIGRDVITSRPWT